MRNDRPPKQGVKEAVSQCMRAGIMPVMITGDHRDTAFAIAKRLGIAQSEEQVLTGTELDTLPEEVLNKQIPKTRCAPRDQAVGQHVGGDPLGE